MNYPWRNHMQDWQMAHWECIIFSLYFAYERGRVITIKTSSWQRWCVHTSKSTVYVCTHVSMKRMIGFRSVKPITVVALWQRHLVSIYNTSFTNRSGHVLPRVSIMWFYIKADTSAEYVYVSIFTCYRFVCFFQSNVKQNWEICFSWCKFHSDIAKWVIKLNDQDRRSDQKELWTRH